MTPHRAVIEAGPASIRRLCCGAGEGIDTAAAALDAIDDPVALVHEQPVVVDALWSATLRSLAGGHHDGAIVVHPSWWSAARVDVITAAARSLALDDVAVQPRSWLLAQAVSDDPMVVIEIADRLVAIGGPEVVAVARRREPHAVAEDVVGVIETLAPQAMVLIDAPSRIAGAPMLATLIADLAGTRGHVVTAIDDAALGRLAGAVASIPEEPSSGPRSRARTWAPAAVAGVVLTVLAATVAALDVRPPRTPDAHPMPTTVLVEGRVALTVPADWRTQRVTAGPGSARVQVTSPSDPQVALHITQSPTPGETLTGAADRLKRAIDSEPAGVFVDFNPADVSAGRSAVTYREVRAAHDVRWTVFVDGPVRISIGCQSRPQGQDTVREACQEAVRSAHVLD